MDALLPPAIENDRLAFLAELVTQTCRARRIVIRLRQHWSGYAPNCVARRGEKPIVG